MPVISSKALASVFDSYSCVVMVSETTETSLMPLALSLAAASANHLSSAACWSFDKVDGVNSLSIHFLAASACAVLAAGAGVAAGAGAGAVAVGAAGGSSFFPQAVNASATAAASAVYCNFMVVLLFSGSAGSRAACRRSVLRSFPESGRGHAAPGKLRAGFLLSNAIPFS